MTENVHQRSKLSRSKSENADESRHKKDSEVKVQDGNEVHETGTDGDRCDKHKRSATGGSKRGKSSFRMRFSKTFSSFDQENSKKRSMPIRFVSLLFHMMNRKQPSVDDTRDSVSDSPPDHDPSSDNDNSCLEKSSTSRDFQNVPAPPPLNVQEKQRLRETWAELKDDIANVGVETFMGLFNTHPDAIDSFLVFKDYNISDIEQSTILKAHALRVMQTVDKCISRLEEPDKMTSILTSLGERHVTYHAKHSLIPIIGKQFVAAIEPKMGDQWTRENKAAWERLFDVINFHIRDGMTCQGAKRLT